MSPAGSLPLSHWEAQKATMHGAVLSCFSRVRLMDCSPPGSSVHAILKARILEWVAVPSSRGSSRPRIEPVPLMPHALTGGSLPLMPPGKP